jgi:hypothetical protein
MSDYSLETLAVNILMTAQKADSLSSPSLSLYKAISKSSIEVCGQEGADTLESALVTLILNECWNDAQEWAKDVLLGRKLAPLRRF